MSDLSSSEPQGVGVRKWRVVLFLVGIIAFGVAISAVGVLLSEQDRQDSDSSTAETQEIDSSDQYAGFDDDLSAGVPVSMNLIASATIEGGQLIVTFFDGRERRVETGDLIPYEKEERRWNEETRTNERYYEDQVRISPTGDRVVFMAAEDLADPSDEYYNGPWHVGAQIWEYHADDDQIHLLVDTPEQWEEVKRPDEYAVGAAVRAYIDVLEYSPVTGRYVAHDQCGFHVYDTQTGENVDTTGTSPSDDYDSCGLVGGFPRKALWSTDESTIAFVTMFEGGYGINSIYQKQEENGEEVWQNVDVSDLVMHENLSFDGVETNLEALPDMNRLVGILGDDEVIMARSYWRDPYIERGEPRVSSYTEFWAHNLAVARERLIGQLEGGDEGYGAVHDMRPYEEGIRFSFYGDSDGLDAMVRGPYADFLVTEEGLERVHE